MFLVSWTYLSRKVSSAGSSHRILESQTIEENIRSLNLQDLVHVLAAAQKSEKKSDEVKSYRLGEVISKRFNDRQLIKTLWENRCLEKAVEKSERGEFFAYVLDIVRRAHFEVNLKSLQTIR